MDEIKSSAQQQIRHGLFEDLIAMATGATFLALGIVMLNQGHIVTGGVVGLALLVSEVDRISFWPSYFVLSIPFYLFSWVAMGASFAARTLLTVSLTCLFCPLTVAWVAIGTIQPIYASLLGGALIGVGVLIMFRHRTSPGGIGALALWLQHRHGIRAGLVQLVFDASVILGATFVLPAENIVLSLASAAVTGGVLTMNHRLDRYVGVS